MIDQTIKRNTAKRETPKLIQMVCAVAGEELRVVHMSKKKNERQRRWSVDRASGEGEKGYINN